MQADSGPSKRAHGSAAFAGLQKYLRDRFADVVVLTFVQIEDLMGCPLSDAARLQPAWWADAADDGSASPQSRSWSAVGRSATLNLQARTVTFARIAG